MDIVTLQSQIDELKRMEITDITKLAKLIEGLVKTNNVIIDRLEVIEKRTMPDNTWCWLKGALEPKEKP